MQERRKMRGGIASLWTEINPVLLENEWGFESNTGKLKVGDGVTPWNSLSYWVNPAYVPPEPSTRIEVKTIPDSSYELLDEDNNCALLFTNDSGTTVAIAPATGIQVGSIIHLHQYDSNIQVTVQAEVGATLNYAVGLTTRVQYSSLSVICVAEGVYSVIGDAGDLIK